MRILLVEDPLGVPTNAGDLARTLGFRVTRRIDPLAAIESFDVFHFPVAILDYATRGKELCDLCRGIRLQPAGREAHLIAAVSTDQLSLAAELVAAGADEIIPREALDSILPKRLVALEHLAGEKAERKRERDRFLARRQRDRVALDLGRRALEDIHLDRFLDEVVKTVASTLAVEWVGIFKLLPDGSSLVLRIGTGWSNEETRGHRLTADDTTLLGRALLSDKPLAAPPEPTENLGFPARSGSAAPIPAGCVPYGVLAAYSSQSRDFSSDEIDFLSLIANIAASAIARADSNTSLRRRARHFRSLLENTNDVITVLNLDRTFQYVSPSLTRVLGHDPVFLLGRSLDEFVHPDDAEAAIGMLRRIIDHPSEVDQAELRLLHQSNQWRTVEMFAKLGRGEQDQWNLVADFRDITERKRAEEQLRHAKEAAEASARIKSEFLANMSHEIRTPITAILGFTDILLLEADGAAPGSDWSDYLATIKRNGEHLLEVINDILDLSKIESGRVEAERIRFSPARVVADVAALIRPRASAKELALHLTCAGPIPETIVGDPTRLRQILINLAGNAVKFTAQGAVTIQVSAPPVDALPARIRFDVIDTGIGLSTDQLARLFQPFTQADASTTRRYGGTGLGLSISKRLAELMRGAITVQSTPGVGSTFSLTLDAIEPAGVVVAFPEPAPTRRQALGSKLDNTPRDPRPEPVAVTIPTPTSMGGTHGCVLLAEDGPDNQRLISFYLKKENVAVTLAEDGSSAVAKVLEAKAQGHPFDLVLMDMQMPVLDGYGATRALRAAGIDTPVIALTANAMSGDREKCLAAGCDDYITKPIDRTKLLARTQHWIDRSRAGGATGAGGAGGAARAGAAGTGTNGQTVASHSFTSSIDPSDADTEAVSTGLELPRFHAV